MANDFEKLNVRDRDFLSFRNHPDPNKTKVGVDVENEPSDPIPVYQAEIPGNRIHKKASQITIANTEILLINEVVPVDFFWDISQVYLVTNLDGRFRIEINGTDEGSGKTGATILISRFIYNPKFKVNALETVKIYFKPSDYSPVGLKVDAYLHASEINI